MPEQIGAIWPAISADLETYLPPTTNGRLDKMNGVLSALMAGTMQFWFAYSGQQPIAYCITSVVNEMVTGEKNLLVYATKAFRPVGDDVLEDSINGLKAFARKMGCSYVIGYVYGDKALNLSTRAGAQTFNLVRFGVN